ncbi:MAG: hypothetical protein HKM88_01490 [Halobacteria archaeon]|nr:hypothetical protein [Halobacteria archaeon]
MSKEKGRKEKTPGGLIAARFSCASRQNRRSPNSQSRTALIAQTGGSLALILTAMLGCAYGKSTRQILPGIFRMFREALII